MTSESAFGFSWEFIDEMSWWSLGLGAVAAVTGTLVTGDIAFAVACLLAVALDVVLVKVSSRRAREGLAEGRIDHAAAVIMLPVRLGAKALLLLLTFAVPEVLSFAGAVVGVLVFDLTLAVVGSIKAASRTMRQSKQGG